jgi:hypothetical protein
MNSEDAHCTTGKFMEGTAHSPHPDHHCHDSKHDKGGLWMTEPRGLQCMSCLFGHFAGKTGTTTPEGVRCDR